MCSVLTDQAASISKLAIPGPGDCLGSKVIFLNWHLTSVGLGSEGVFPLSLNKHVRERWWRRFSLKLKSVIPKFLLLPVICWISWRVVSSFPFLPFFTCESHKKKSPDYVQFIFHHHKIKPLWTIYYTCLQYIYAYTHYLCVFMHLQILVFIIIIGDSC